MFAKNASVVSASGHEPAASADDKAERAPMPNPSVVLDDYGWVDIAVHWQLFPELRISVAADNLFNEQYFDADGFEANGRRGRLKLVWRH